MFRYRTSGLLAVGGLALLSGCKHHRAATEMPISQTPIMVGTMPVGTMPVGVEYPVGSYPQAGIIAGPMPHLMEPGVLPMPGEKKTVHNHPTGLWPSMSELGKAPTKPVEDTTPSNPKTTLTSIPGPVVPPPVGATVANETPPATGPAFTSIPTTFLAAPKETETTSRTNIINQPRDTSPVVHLMGLKSGERMGHGPNYRWVAGVLDKHQKGGFWTLRYADYSSDDAWGGKVRLIDDPRLANFKNGDVVFLEGELLSPTAKSADGAGYPPYKISQISTLDSGR